MGWLILRWKDRGTERGKDRIFDLPLRVCEKCQTELTSPAEWKAALCRVPLYDELLRKYPNAHLSSAAR
jgi:hypothetical protein